MIAACLSCVSLLFVGCLCSVSLLQDISRYKYRWDHAHLRLCQLFQHHRIHLLTALPLPHSILVTMVSPFRHLYNSILLFIFIVITSTALDSAAYLVTGNLSSSPKWLASVVLIGVIRVYCLSFPFYLKAAGIAEHICVQLLCLLLVHLIAMLLWTLNIWVHGALIDLTIERAKQLRGSIWTKAKDTFSSLPAEIKRTFFGEALQDDISQPPSLYPPGEEKDAVTENCTTELAHLDKELASLDAELADSNRELVKHEKELANLNTELMALDTELAVVLEERDLLRSTLAPNGEWLHVL